MIYKIDPSHIPGGKHLLACLYRNLGFAYIEQACSRRDPRYILAVCYHSTPLETVASFERHLQWFSKHFINVDRNQLDLFLAGKWPYSKPGIMLHFDDGMLNQAEVAAPLLEKYGFTGWFQITTDLLDNLVTIPFATMSWEQAGELIRRNHVLCAHSATHKHLKAQLTDAEIEYEVAGPLHKMKVRLGTAPFAYCYPCGEAGTYDIRAVRLAKQYYQYAFTTYFGRIDRGVSPYALSRCHLESGWKLEDVLLSTSHWWMLKHRKIKDEYLSALNSL